MRSVTVPPEDGAVACGCGADIAVVPGAAAASGWATNGTDSGTSQANTAPATTSPSKVCLPVLCLG
ncbi:hypothetical protein ACFVRU_00400 [Streptomyces sp. NPDC057927]